MSFIQFWPQQVSAYGAEVDRLVLSLLVLVLVLSAPVFFLTIGFAVKYRRGRAVDRRQKPRQHVGLELSWTIVPFVLVVAFYVWATRLYFDAHQSPLDALEIQVVAKQWMWKFQHPAGQREINELHVPTDRAVRLIMASEDVIHSLYLPVLRLKQDVVPGRYTSLWFKARTTGDFTLTCAEFCGADHSVMGGHLHVMAAADYARWLEQARVAGSLAERGANLFRSLGCSGCHGTSATVRAPQLEGLFGRPVALASGEVVTADEQYLRDSILLPQAQITAGYAPIMPTYRNLIGEDGVLALVAYIKSLGSSPRPAPP